MVLEEFDEDLDEPSNEKIYSSGDQGVKKDLRGTRNGEILVPFLFRTGLN